MVETATPPTDVTDAVTRWLEDNWDPDLTVGEWWARIGESGWAFPAMPSCQQPATSEPPQPHRGHP